MKKIKNFYIGFVLHIIITLCIVVPPLVTYLLLSRHANFSVLVFVVLSIFTGLMYVGWVFAFILLSKLGEEMS